MLAVSAAGALAQRQASNAALSQQAETANNNLRLTYAANQEQSRAADAQAFEQQTDRARKAAQQLSMARVIAAQGGGSLTARAINIQAGAAEDYSRIDAGLRNTRSSIQSSNAAAITSTQDKLDQINAGYSASNLQFFTSLAGGAANAYTGEHARTTQKNLAKNYKQD
ncbi:virion core protein, T7 gp14 family [Xylophilus sp.]|uniref:virion core protein, T7 gp14 family n=1 Tax=Xylophilus sp. TaxID=2653893 RepID=UPI002D7E45B9|nr:hypothetical protein [Xylophilus sp.]